MIVKRLDHRTSKSGLVVLVTVLCVTGQLLSAAHKAGEVHVRCAEHGEVSHIPTGMVADFAPSQGPSAVPVAQAGQAGHDHCGFAACFQRRQPEPILLVAAAPEPAPPSAPAPAPVLKSQTDRILLSAPKIAPPC
jgi:hypothetical protein